MPIVEYYSPDTHTIYQFYARTLADAARAPRCPAGENFRMERLLSKFAVTGRAKEPAPGGGENSISPEQEAAMMQIASKFEGLSDENPDPRQLGRLMREMSPLLPKGANPEQMEEVIRRLESGEDPEALEEHFEAIMGEGGEEGMDEGGETKGSSLRARRAAPAHRDATLYELRDYLAGESKKQNNGA